MQDKEATAMQDKGKSLPVADTWFQGRVYIDNQHIVIYKN
jgi:hypothetical protein